jgi:tetraacyldisaccharide 4'-kinase
VVSRGYGRRVIDDGVTVVSDGTHLLADLDTAGDEPLLLARALPGLIVLVADQRAVAARLAEQAFGATVVLADDAFQHASLRRDADLVVVSPEDLGARALPFGPLREPVSALARAHAVVIDGVRPAGWAPPAGVAVFEMRRRLAGPAPQAATPVFAFAGIASPDRFRRALDAAGWKVAGFQPFADHHRFRSDDLARIAARAASAGARAVLTTEKDAIRLLPLRPWPVPISAVPLEVTLDPEPAFSTWLVEALRAARRERERA